MPKTLADLKVWDEPQIGILHGKLHGYFPDGDYFVYRNKFGGTQYLYRDGSWKMNSGDGARYASREEAQSLALSRQTHTTP